MAAWWHTLHKRGVLPKRTMRE